MSHRRPTKPPHFYELRDKPGVCRWCAGEIAPTKAGKKSRANWHPDCAEEFRMLHWPGHARNVVWRDADGKCAGCGMQTILSGGGEANANLDHITPLIDGGSHGRENMQILCSVCHKAKTSREARERALRRRGDVKSMKAKQSSGPPQPQLFTDEQQ